MVNDIPQNSSNDIRYIDFVYLPINVTVQEIVAKWTWYNLVRRFLSNKFRFESLLYLANIILRNKWRQPNKPNTPTPTQSFWNQIISNYHMTNIFWLSTTSVIFSVNKILQNQFDRMYSSCGRWLCYYCLVINYRQA